MVAFGSRSALSEMQASAVPRNSEIARSFAKVASCIDTLDRADFDGWQVWARIRLAIEELRASGRDKPN